MQINERTSKQSKAKQRKTKQSKANQSKAKSNKSKAKKSKGKQIKAKAKQSNAKQGQADQKFQICAGNQARQSQKILLKFDKSTQGTGSWRNQGGKKRVQGTST